MCALSPLEKQLLAEAQQWRLVALMFERPRAGWWTEVAQLSEGCPDAELAAAAHAASAAREGDYLEFLGPGGLVSPREAGHRKTTDPSKLLSEIHAYYSAFGFEPATEETIDHVAVEAGFVGFMRLKEAYARVANDSAAADLTAEAARRFVHAHLAAMAEPLEHALRVAGGDYLGAAARSLVARTGPRPADVEGGWVPEGLAGDDCAFVCGDRSGACASADDDATPGGADPFGAE